MYIIGMGEIYKPKDVKLLAAVMHRRDFDARPIEELLTAAYGEVGGRFGPIEFSWSRYYEEEMGEGLLKYYLIFKAPIDRSRLPSIKNHTNQIESQFSVSGKRAVNIDPGYLAKDKLVLASSKDFYHRLYLGEGIFGEVTLHYRKGRFRHFSWTYTDYQGPEFYKFLEAAREELAGGRGAA
jgi:hypothetical protein